MHINRFQQFLADDSNGILFEIQRQITEVIESKAVGDNMLDRSLISCYLFDYTEQLKSVTVFSRILSIDIKFKLHSVLDKAGSQSVFKRT